MITVGDILGDFYISFVGDMQGSTFLTMAVAEESTIGFTWYGDYIVLAKNLETEAPTYRVYTTDSFVDTMLDSDTNVSPIAWLLGTNSIVWATVTALFDLTSLSATTLSGVQAIGSNETSGAQNLFDRLNIGYYVSAIEVKLDNELGASYGDMDVESMFGLTDDYWAFVLGDEFIDDVAGGILTDAAIALTQNMSQLGGIYVVGSVFGVLDLTLSLNYESSLKSTYDLFDGNLVLAATSAGETGTSDTLVTKNIQIVPNLYYVFTEGMAGYGATENTWTFADLENQSIEVSYTVGGFFGIGGTTYTVTTTANCDFIYYEYTVGESSYKAVYSYEVTVHADEDTSTTDTTVSGTYTVEIQLPNPPEASENESEDE